MSKTLFEIGEDIKKAQDGLVQVIHKEPSSIKKAVELINNAFKPDNTKGDKMQEFENGDEVEVYIFGKWFKAIYIALSKSKGYDHVIQYKKRVEISGIIMNNGSYDDVVDHIIRPVSKICEKAKELINDSLCKREFQYKVKVESRKQYDELMVIVNARIKYYKFFGEFNQLSSFKEMKLPELNLKTGNVIPVEPPKCSDSYVTMPDCKFYEMEREIDSLENMKQACEQALRELTKEQTQSDVMKNQLKEKDAEIEKINIFINAYRRQLKEKNIEIVRLTSERDHANDWLRARNSKVEQLNKKIENNRTLFLNKDIEIKEQSKRITGLCDYIEAMKESISSARAELNNY